MIRQLVREQFRSHRTYLIWTTALLTLAVAMASYAAFTAAQGVAVSSHAAASFGMDGAWNGDVMLSEDPYADKTVTRMTPAELEEVVETANAEGAGAVALAPVSINVSALPPADRDRTADEVADWPLYLPAAMTGQTDAAALLASGHLPAPGEAAVSADWATSNGLGVGDTVWPYATVWPLDDEPPREVELGPLTVSGLLRDPLSGGYGVQAHDALVNWETAAAFNDAMPDTDAPPWEESLLQHAAISAEVETPTLTAIIGGSWSNPFGITTATLAPTVLAVGAAVLVLGLIGMSFAVGRAQAQARSGWVATARVLGARRSTVAMAALLEVLGVGLVAGLAGAALGYGVVALDWAVLKSSQPDALAPAGMQVPLWTWGAMIGLGAVVAGIIGAIPAFWAARVAPAAALKPVTPATQAEVSRRAPFWPAVSLWLLFTIPMLVGLHASDTRLPFMDVLSLATPVLGFGAVVTSVPLVIELTRHVVAVVARRVARATRPWAVAAGSALVGRPRQASGPASVLALASTVAFAVTTWTSLARWADQSPSIYWGTDATPGPLDQVVIGTGYDDFGVILLGIIAIGMATLVAVAVGAFVSLRQATTAESDATAALGLDAREARLASGMQFGLPLATGTTLGAVLGTAVAIAVFSYQHWEPIAATTDGTAYSDSVMVGPGWALVSLGHAAVPIALALGIGLACIAVGSGMVALTTRTSARPLAGSNR